MRIARQASVVQVAVLVATVAWVPAAAQLPTVKIAFLGPLSGPFVPWGVNARDGMRMAIAELNEAGGILGHRVELVERDDRNSPAEAITALRFLVERESVLAATGMISSDVGLAVSREAEALRVPVVLIMAGSHVILRRASRFTFRTCDPAAPMQIEPIADLVRYARYARVGAIVADYAWGHAIREFLERRMSSIPGVRLQVEVAPVATPDFAPYLRRLQAFDPQILVAVGHPPGAPTIVRQVAELGMRSPVIGTWYPPELMVQRAGEAVFGRLLDYSCVDFTTPAFRKLAAKFYAVYRRYFDNSAFSGYVAVRMVAEAARRSGSLEGGRIAEQIRKGRFVQPGYAWPLAYTEWGEPREVRMIFYSIQRGEAPSGVCPGCGWFQKYEFRSSLIKPYTPSDS